MPGPDRRGGAREDSASGPGEAQSTDRSNRTNRPGLAGALGGDARQCEDFPGRGSHAARRRGVGGRNLSTARPVLLDTCAAIWLMNGDPMSPGSRAAVSAAQAQNAGVFVSPISAWEVGTLAARNRIQLTHDPEIW